MPKVFMILAIDIGNSHSVLGLFDHKKVLKSSWRIRTIKDQTADEFLLSVMGLMEKQKLNPSDLEGVVLGSVVPALTEELKKAFSNQNLLVIDCDKKFDFQIKVQNPQTVGADRLINAQAALAEYKPPLLIIDAGTATTFCYLNESFEYRGGSILPGLHISAQALYKKTSKLMAVDFEFPKSLLGDTTESALKSGIMFGYVCMIDGLINKYKEEVNKNITVIGTGGLISLLIPQIKNKIHYDSNLTLKGLISLWTKNSF